MPVRAIQWCPVYTEGAELGGAGKCFVKTRNNKRGITEMSCILKRSLPFRNMYQALKTVCGVQIWLHLPNIRNDDL